MSPRGSWFFFCGSFFSWFLLTHPGSHRPLVLATSVPLEEWDYHHTGKCSLFVQLYVLKVILGILS